MDTVSRRLRVSVSTLFLVHGFVFATWVSRIPAMQGRLSLRASELGLALLGIAMGSMLSMPVAGMIMARWGTAAVATVSSLAFCIVLILPGMAINAVTLGLALGAFGLAAGAMDVSMNAQAVAVEERYERSLMSSFHALFSIGGMAGAAIGGWVASYGVAPIIHFAAFGAICLALILYAIPGLVPHDHHGLEHRPAFRITPQLAVLAAIAFCFFLSEGAIADWSGLYLRQVLGTGAATAALGYAVFSAVMAVGRLTGDMLIDRFGRVALVRAGSAVAACGLGAALVVGTVPAALVGFGLTGAGCAVIVPIAFAAAGRVRDLPPGTALTAVTAMGYFGLFAGPPAIGVLADVWGLKAALFVPVALTGAGVLLAGAAGVPTTPTSQESPDSTASRTGGGGR